MGLTRVPLVDDKEMFKEMAQLVLAAPVRPDPMPMDIGMPAVDGIEPSRRQKADPATPCIVAFTAFTACAPVRNAAGDEYALTAAGRVRRAVLGWR